MEVTVARTQDEEADIHGEREDKWVLDVCVTVKQRNRVTVERRTALLER